MVRRVYTIACGFILSVALAGCVDPAAQDGASDQGEGPVTIVEVQTDTEKGGEAPEIRPDTAKADEATAPRQETTSPSDSQADPAPDEPPKSPESKVQETAPAAGPPVAAELEPVPPVAPPVPEKPAIDDDPERLMGLGTGALTQMLGRPGFVRRDASAQLWRYRNESCILDLFLYRGTGRPEYFVSYIEARRSEGGAAVKRECLGALLLEQRDREAG